MKSKPTFFYELWYRLGSILLLFPIVLITYNAQGQNKDKKISQTFYFTGNTGVDDSQYTANVLSAINKMSQADEKATFVGLGNITQNGFPSENKEREKAKKILQETLLDPMKNFNGRVIYIPGKNEWNTKNAHENIDDMESFIQDNSKAEFWPNDGCVREIEDLDTENIELLMIDSQWFLENWDNHLYINNKCEIKSREDFYTKFKDDVKDEQNKVVIVAVHHSVLSNTMRNFFEKIGGFKKESFYSKQREKLKGILETLGSLFPDVMFVSSSDRNLQYVYDDGTPQIISGTAGKKNRKAKTDKENQFASDDHGFARLIVYNDNSSLVEFYSVSEGKTNKVFSNNIQTEQTSIEEVNYHDIDKFETTKKASVYSEEETDKSGLYKLFWGDHYRHVYSKKIEAPVLNLNTLPGNPKAISEGGGNQSRSIRIKDDDEHEYTLREIRKSAVRFLQSSIKDHYVEDYFNNTIAEDLVQDFYTTAHPYAPFALNPIFDSLNIYNAKPEIYYLPKQEKLGIFNKSYGDKLYMLEAHAGDENKEFALFGSPDEIISTTDLLLEMQKSEQLHVDEANYLKVRLMDMLIGDWDRHYDQWRWAGYKQEDGSKIYKTIRRDRDQAFPKYDGLLIKLLKFGFPLVRPMEDYDADVKNVKWLNFFGYPLDKRIIKNSEWDDWKEQVELIQATLTDETIDKAFESLPNEAQDETTEEIKRKFKARRDNLIHIAKDYYAYLNKHEVITGSENDDKFTITRKPNGVTSIAIRTNDEIVYEKEYHRDLTKDIWIYGLDGKDEFKTTGDGDHLINIKVLGGENNDTYDFQNNRKIKIYDYKSKKNTIKSGSTKWLTDSYDINKFDEKKREYYTNTIFPGIGFDPDTGFRAGILNTFTQYGLVNNPFHSQHKLGVNFYSATSGLEFIYSSEFAHIFYKWNLGMDLYYTSPNYAINYFGTGNETVYDNELVDRDYNRIRIQQWRVSPSLIFKDKDLITFSIGPILESLKVEYNENSVTDELFDPANDVFDSQMYVGGELSFEFSNKKNLLSYPRRGMQLNVVTGYKYNINGFDNKFGYIKPSLSIDYPLHESGIAVLATKIGSNIVLGNDFEFYHSATLGGNNSLRGYRNDRFYGKTSFYQSTDLRIGLTKFRTNFIPIRMGVTAGFDYGRVWLANDDSEDWHNNYGGSVFINGFNALTGNLGFYHSKDGNRIMFSLGFLF